MTTNETMENIRQEIERVAHKDVNIQINYDIASSVNFLDVQITNKDGRLKTTVYHKPAAEPYVLPYQSDHPRHIHRNIPYAGILRAARICSDLDDFNKEMVRMDLSLLLNGYPPNFIRTQFHRLFHRTDNDSLSTPMDQTTYHCLHRTLLNQPTRRETQLNRMMHDPIIHPSVLQPKVWDRKVMYPRYLFDSSRSSLMKYTFFEWWKQNYAEVGSSVTDVKVRLVPETQRILEAFLVKKKPSKTLLKKLD